MSEKFFTPTQAFQNEVDGIKDLREGFLEDNQIVQTNEMLSLLPEEMFAVAMFGIDQKLYGKFDHGTSDYTEDEIDTIIEAAQSFIKQNNIDTMMLVLDVLIFNCQCQYAGMYMIMNEINEYLSDKNIQYLNIDKTC